MIVSLFNLTSLDWSYLNNKFNDFFAFKSKQKATKKFNKTKKASTGSKQNQNDGQQANSQSQQQKQALGAEQRKRYCAILGVTESATQEELHKAYTSLAKRYHPDTVQDEMLKLVLTEKLKEINTAYQKMRELCEIHARLLYRNRVASRLLQICNLQICKSGKLIIHLPDKQ